MRGWAWPGAGIALALSLQLPWFYGTDDGSPLTIPGFETEPGFTLGMLACACGIAATGRIKQPLVAVVSAVPAIALTLWMLPRGERYSGDDLGPGGFATLTVAVIALAMAVVQQIRRFR